MLIRFPSVRPRINVAPFRSFVRDVNREFGFSLRTFRDYSRGGFLCSVDMHLPSDRQAGFLKGDPMTVIRYLTDTGRCVGYETRVSRGRRAPPLLEYLSICVRNERPALSRQLSTFRALFFVNRNCNESDRFDSTGVHRLIFRIDATLCYTYVFLRGRKLVRKIRHGICKFVTQGLPHGRTFDEL